MPSTQDLRRKISSVKATGKLTKAMQMVAASKMSRATAAATASRTYARAAWALLGDLAGRTEVSHPLFAPLGDVSDSAKGHRPEAETQAKRAIVLLTSNRGLAGSFNSQVIRQVTKELTTTVDVITIGRKGLGYIKRFYPSNLVADFPASDSTPRANEAQPIAAFVVKAFLDGTYSRVDVAYNQFVSTLTQKPVLEQLLPILPEAPTNETEVPAVEFLVEPDPQSVLAALATRIVPLRLYQMLLESSASEHSARMIAMKSATDNAKEIVDDLTLTYQSVRQANITRQIIEVSSGAAALAG